MLSRRDLIRSGSSARAPRPCRPAAWRRSRWGTACRPETVPPAPTVPRLTPFAATLPIPTPLAPTRVDAVGDHYDIFMHEADVQLLPGRKTRMMTYNGTFPGPMIVARLNRPAIVTYHNQLSVNTSVHNHGEYVSGDSDGHPDDAILPGHSKTCFYPNTSEKPPDDIVSHTQWFHDHVEHATAFNVYHGLAGLYLFKDPKDAVLNLPSGPFDIPLVFTDKIFNADHSLFYTFGDNGSGNGFLGDVMQVNGAPLPRLAVSRRKYRFRILNACDARNLQLGLGSNGPITIIASEAGFLRRPAPAASVFMAPAERYEIVIDFARFPIGARVPQEPAGWRPNHQRAALRRGARRRRHEHRAARTADHRTHPRGPGKGAAAVRLRARQRAMGHQRQDVRPEPDRRPAAGRRHRDLDAR